MKPFSILLALAAIASAELVPLISEPRSVAGAGLSLTAFGDSVFSSQYDHVGLFARTGDRIVAVSDQASDVFNSEHPRLYHFSTGIPDLALGSTVLGGLDRSASPWLVSPQLPGIQLGHRWVTGGMFQGAVGDMIEMRRILACGQNRAYDLQINLMQGTPTSHWTIVDSLDLPTGGSTICDVDPKTGLAVMMTPDSALKYSVRVHAASSILHSNSVSFHAQRVDWALMGWDNQWVAWDGLRHLVYGAVDFNPIDSMNIDLPPATYPSGVVARRDSIVAFGQNGTLVLAKWTQGTPLKFKIVSRTVLSATRNIASVAIADSTLWATLGDTLYSFRLRWGQATGVSRSDATPLRSGLGVLTTGDQVAFTWNGAGSASFDIVDVQGHQATSIRLDPGTTGHWTAPRAGIWFARSATGSRMFLAK